jgi:hypothetical protein
MFGATACKLLKFRLPFNISEVVGVNVGRGTYIALLFAIKYLLSDITLNFQLLFSLERRK